ncbi:MAG: hypothetical protein CL472_06390 [Acidobacteria bacterium]|nr:hypothetical protein [Acidobacteriota bacterium]
MTDHPEYSHERWIAENPDAKIITGDERALAALREATRKHHDVDDITEDAPVISWMGGYVKGHGKVLHSIPADAVSAYLVPGEFPNPPHAVWPEEASKTNRDELLSNSNPAEGDPLGIAEIFLRTRLYHEVDEETFPQDGELRWFLNGLHIIGKGDDPIVFQTPMGRVEDLIVPRVAPTLPWIKAPKLAS